MKIQCPTCAARYSVPDEKILGRNVAVRCKRCGERMGIQGAADTWHVAIDGASEGPLGLGELLARIDAKEVGPDAHVWRDGMDAWVPAREAAELVGCFEQAPASPSEPPIEAPAPEPALTGGRSESSVLFSLSNLRELSRTEAAPTASATTEGSGLIDIRALAKSTFETAPAPAPAADELLAFGGAGLGSPLGAPVVLPERRNPPSKTPIVIGVAVAGLAALAAAAVIAWVETRPAAEAPGARMAHEGPIVSPEQPVPGAIQPTPSAPSAVAPIPDAPAVEAPSAEAPEAPTEAPTPIAAPTPRARPRSRPEPTHPHAEPPPRPTPAARPAPAGDDPLARIFDERPAPAPTTPARQLPSTPSRSDVVGAMRGLEAPVRACAAGSHGMATVRFSFGSDGRVRSADVEGDLPPAVRACVARAARGARLPEFSRDAFAVAYPFRL